MMMICEGILGDFSLVILKGSFFYITKKSSKSRGVIAKKKVKFVIAHHLNHTQCA